MDSKKAMLLSVLLVPICLLLVLPGKAHAGQNDVDPLLPAIASFIIPGAGQLLNDQSDKALVHFAVWVGLDTVALFYLYHSPYVPLYLAPLAWSTYSAYDAYQVAERRGGPFDLSSWEDPSAIRRDSLRQVDSGSLDAWLDNDEAGADLRLAGLH